MGKRGLQSLCNGTQGEAGPFAAASRVPSQPSLACLYRQRVRRTEKRQAGQPCCVSSARARNKAARRCARQRRGESGLISQSGGRFWRQTVSAAAAGQWPRIPPVRWDGGRAFRRNGGRHPCQRSLRLSVRYGQGPVGSASPALSWGWETRPRNQSRRRRWWWCPPLGRLAGAWAACLCLPACPMPACLPAYACLGGQSKHRTASRMRSPRAHAKFEITIARFGTLGADCLFLLVSVASILLGIDASPPPSPRFFISLSSLLRRASAGRCSVHAALAEVHTVQRCCGGWAASQAGAAQGVSVETWPPARPAASSSSRPGTYSHRLMARRARLCSREHTPAHALAWAATRTEKAGRTGRAGQAGQARAHHRR